MTPSVQNKLDLLMAHVMDGMLKCWTFHVLTNCWKPLMPHNYNERGYPVRSDPCEELWLVRAPAVRAAGREMSVKHHRVKQGTDKSLGNTRDYPVVKRGCRGRWGHHEIAREKRGHILHAENQKSKMRRIEASWG
jgi:hypothetical protein